MAEVEDAKRRIVEELAATRGELLGAGLALKERLNFQRRFSEFWKGHSWTWIGGSVLIGWILSRLPARKKKVYIEAGGARARRGQGLGGTIAKHLWAVAWTVAKPVLTAYLTRTLAGAAKRSS